MSRRMPDSSSGESSTARRAHGAAASPLFCLIDAGPRRSRSTSAKAYPLAFQPLFELGRDISYEHAREQVPAIELGRTPPVSGFARQIEFSDVASQRVGVHPDFLFSPVDQHVRPELGAEKAHRLPEGSPRVRQVKLGPEKGDDGVPATKPQRAGCGEIHEEGEALGLHQNRMQLAPV